MKQIGLCVSVLIVLGMGVAPATALPIVALDADTSLAGIQSTATVNQGDSFAVDLVLSGVDAADPLNGFEFDLNFDPSILAATSVTDGGFLLAPVFEVQNLIGAALVEFAEATLLPVGAAGDGILASITFNALAPGLSVLALNNVVLAAPFGVPILTDGINDAEIRVLAAVPVPGSLALFGLGLLGLVRRRCKP